MHNFIDDRERNVYIWLASMRVCYLACYKCREVMGEVSSYDLMYCSFAVSDAVYHMYYTFYWSTSILETPYDNLFCRTYHSISHNYRVGGIIRCNLWLILSLNSPSTNKIDIGAFVFLFLVFCTTASSDIRLYHCCYLCFCFVFFSFYITVWVW